MRAVWGLVKGGRAGCCRAASVCGVRKVGSQGWGQGVVAGAGEGWSGGGRVPLQRVAHGVLLYGAQSKLLRGWGS